MAQQHRSAVPEEQQDKSVDPTIDRILSAASTLFAANGFTSTTADAIAQASGISKPTLYRRFESKTDILLEIRQKHFSGLIRKARELVADSDSNLTTLNRLFAYHIRHSLDRRDDFLTVIQNRSALKLLIGNKDISDDYLDIIRDCIYKIIKESNIDLPHPEMILRSFVALTNWPILWFREDGGQITIDVLERQSWAIFANGFLRAAVPSHHAQAEAAGRSSPASRPKGRRDP